MPPAADAPFALLDSAAWNALCDAAEAVLQEQPACLRLRAPLKIFGDVHGQFADLLTLFAAFGAPAPAAACAGGDLGTVDYLFLGDYVDRGPHSLETVALLFALLVAHTRRVHLLRGNHECAAVNLTMGFREECDARLGAEAGGAVWERVNRVFDWLPLAALVEGRVLCVHGGIGGTLSCVDDIDRVVRPLDGTLPIPDVANDLLWSDPAADASVQGVAPSSMRGVGATEFGAARLREFCATAGVQMVVRGHECVQYGVERFGGGGRAPQLVTVFSAPNYCGVLDNAGAVLLLDRDLVLTPMLLMAPPPQPLEADEEGWVAAAGEEEDARVCEGAENNTVVQADEEVEVVPQPQQQ